jgi:hypothetical protein
MNFKLPQYFQNFVPQINNGQTPPSLGTNQPRNVLPEAYTGNGGNNAAVVTEPTRFNANAGFFNALPQPLVPQTGIQGLEGFANVKGFNPSVGAKLNFLA